MKAFFRIAAVLLLLLGIAWVFLPRQMLSLWGAQPEGVAVYLGRRYGGLFFGYADRFYGSVELLHHRGLALRSWRAERWSPPS